MGAHDLTLRPRPILMSPTKCIKLIATYARDCVLQLWKENLHGAQAHPDKKQINIDLNENFLWDMEEFKAVRALKEKKITITSIYLTGDAKENPDGAGRTAVNRKLKKEGSEGSVPPMQCGMARSWLIEEGAR